MPPYIFFTFCTTAAPVYGFSDNKILPKQASLNTDHFIPRNEGVNINWVMDQQRGCEWCDTIFSKLMKGLTENYSPSSIYTEVNIKSLIGFDLKGTCFLNWFLGTEFDKLATILKSHLFSRERNEDWFIFLDVSLI